MSNFGTSHLFPSPSSLSSIFNISHKFTLSTLFPPPSLFILVPPPLQQAIPVNPWGKFATEESRPVKSVGEFQIFILSPLHHIQSYRPIPNSAADYLLWLLLTLYPHSQGIRKIMCLLSPPHHPLPFQSISCQNLGTHSTQKHQYPQMAG